jgi:hypothetical protein
MRKREITYVLLNGGLGNQLFQYAAALSRSSDEILLEWSMGNPRLNTDGLPEISDFNSTDNSKLVEFNKSRFYTKLSNFILIKGLNQLKENRFRFGNLALLKVSKILYSLRIRKPITVIQGQDNGYSYLGKVARNELLIGYFQTYKWMESIEVHTKMQQLKLLKKSAKLLEFIQNYRDINWLLVHVRLGDYNLQKNFGILSSSYYEQSMKIAIDNNNFKKILLFSDDPVNALKLLPAEHLDKIVVAPDFDNHSSEVLEAMRHAKGYIIANSTLSWWGATLSYAVDPLVIAPIPWFKSSPEPNLIVPDSWVRTKSW